MVVALAASIYVAAQRVRVESRNKAVELVVDYAEIAQITAATGQSPIDVLRALKQSGVTSVAVSERTVRDLMDTGEIFTDPDTFSICYVETQNFDIPGHLAMAMPQIGVRSSPRKSGRGLMRTHYLSFSEQLSKDCLEQLPVGLPKLDIWDVRFSGLQVIARLVNYPGATPSAADRILAEVKSKGIDKVIFQGDQVLGFKGAVKDTAAALVKNGLMFGQVEFAKQKGETELAEHAPGNVIPVHSITQNEMPTLSESEIVERFRKAVRERGVRICYVRMYDTAGADVLRKNCDYIRKIAGAIRQAGYTLKVSHPLEEVRVPAWARVLAGAGVAAGAVLLLMALVDLSARASATWAAAGVAVCCSLAAGGDIGRKAAALTAAFVFPTLAALWAVRRAPETPNDAKRLPPRAIGRLLGAAAITVAGGVLIVGLLSSRVFMLRIDQFMGIKAAHVVPILLLAAAFAGDVAWKPDTWRAQKRRFSESIGRVLGSPVLMWQAVGLLVVLVLIGLMVARSGNDAGLEVSSVELKLRSILDRVLVARPRTKEFLIGYPLLFVGIAAAMLGRRRWAAVLVTLGSIGLISALNSFCHIHTPLTVTALRTVNGLVIGGIIGLIAWWVLGRHTGQGRVQQ